MNISVQVCGDHWINPQEVESSILLADKNSTITLDLNTEGVSLYAIGLVEMLANHNINPEQVEIANWPNAVENIPFTRVYRPLVSHFFWLCERYWADNIPLSDHTYKFGLFVGRRTPSRATMIYEMYKNYPTQTLLSVMHQRPPAPWVVEPNGIYLEKINNWIQESEFEKFVQWWNNCPITSLDNTQIADQYNPNCNTNQSLLSFYSKFDIEIIAETYTLGNTFFPTEKTVRPLMAAKPFVLYGPKDFLSRLQDLGFCTFNTCWPEDYDNLEGPARWQKIKQVLDNFVRLSQQEQADIINAATKIAQQNREHLVTLIKKYKPG